MMKQTEILKINNKAIEKAVTVLERGGLVAFPTETVYGLGASAENDMAVAAIFEAKGRPVFNPLIVHISDLKMAEKYGEINSTALKLAKSFWAGPFTMVVKRKNQTKLSRLVSAGMDTVALRMPENNDARRLIEKLNIGIAAPSANISGTVSATSAAHVMKNLSGLIDLVLDGGACTIGIESTIVDVCGDEVTVLRPGGITNDEIEKVVGKIKVFDGANNNNPKAPGMLSSHYAPSLPVRLNAKSKKPGEVYLGFGLQNGDFNLSPSGNLKEAAANLFAFLYELDCKEKFIGIAVAPIPNDGLGYAINDRLKRAAALKN